MGNMECLVNKSIQYDGVVYKFKRGEDAPEMSAELKEKFKEWGYIGGKTRKSKPKTEENKEEVIIDPEQHIIEEEQVFKESFRKEDNE